jgi:hypothetical protein
MASLPSLDGNICTALVPNKSELTILTTDLLLNLKSLLVIAKRTTILPDPSG